MTISRLLPMDRGAGETPGVALPIFHSPFSRRKIVVLRSMYTEAAAEPCAVSAQSILPARRGAPVPILEA
jgi:hypothetical protein